MMLVGLFSLLAIIHISSTWYQENEVKQAKRFLIFEYSDYFEKSDLRIQRLNDPAIPTPQKIQQVSRIERLNYLE